MILPHFLPHPRPLFTQEEKPRALRYAWGWFRVRVECRYQSTTLPSPLVTTRQSTLAPSFPSSTRDPKAVLLVG